jgi:uncharacterized membrane protein YoaK (UPF0700 family)
MRAVTMSDTHPTERAISDSLQARLPQALLSLTFVTGLIDAVSFVGLGHVFTANMTGNVVFLGFALGGAGGLSPYRSIAALLAFALGALAGGRLGTSARRTVRDRVLTATVWEGVLILTATAVAFWALRSQPVATAYTLIVVTAVAMGFRNAVVRKLGVPDLTTTVLTLTITGLASDSSLARGENPRWARRLLSVIAMFGGALVGTILLLRFGLYAPLGLSTAIVAAIGAGIYFCSDEPPVSTTREAVPL